MQGNIQSLQKQLNLYSKSYLNKKFKPFYGKVSPVASYRKTQHYAAH